MSVVNDSLASKLEIHDDSVFAVIGAPADFADWLGDTGLAVWQHHLTLPVDVLVVFVADPSSINGSWATWTDAVLPNGAVWLVCAKDASESVRHAVRKAGHDRWADNKSIAVQGGQMALRFMQQKDTRPPWKR